MAEYNLDTRLILKDGTVLENCTCGYSSRQLWCFLHDVSFAEAFQHFSSPEQFETVVFEMTFEKTTDRITYSGFEDLIGITKDDDVLKVGIEGYRINVKKERIYNNKDGGETS